MDVFLRTRTKLRRLFPGGKQNRAPKVVES